MITNNKKERTTSQKKIIFDYLKSVSSHPSARQVHSAVKKKLPQISLGTVYRILENLEEKGEVQRIICKEVRYDGCLAVHVHFICEKCGNIFDIWEKIRIPEIKKIKVGKIKKYQVCFYGICKKCQSKNKN